MVNICFMMVNNIWLVVEPHPSEKYESVGMIFNSQLNGKSESIHIPNHQPGNLVGMECWMRPVLSGMIQGDPLIAGQVQHTFLMS